MTIREEAVTVLRLDVSDLPAKSQQAAQAFGKVEAAGVVSARQISAAMRQLPAQMTDVATQLAGGQNPLLILLQQGGQVKDSFGGIRPAIAAVTAALNPMAVAAGAAALGVGALGLAYVKGSKEADEYQRAILLTGNAAGVTGGQLQALAAQQDALAGTQARAAEVLAQLVATGSVSRAQLAISTEAAIALERSLGVEAEITIKALASLAKEPLEASVRLNEQYRHLTASTYEQIKALKEQGRTAEATAVAQEAFARSGIERAQKMEGSLGILQRAWRSLGSVAKETWDFMLGLGRKETVEEQLVKVQADLAKAAKLSRLPAFSSSPLADTERLRQREAELQELLRLSVRAADREAQQVAAVTEKAAADAKNKRETRQGKDKPLFVGVPDSEIRAIERGRRELEHAGIVQMFRDETQQEEQARRLRAAQDEFLQEVRDANERASIALIADEQLRDEALVALDRRTAQRRLVAKGFTGAKADEAGQLLDEQQSLASQRRAQDREKDAKRLADKEGEATYNSMRDALSAAFRDTQNPAKAFAEALGNAVYTRLTARIAEAMATAAVGKDGSGGWLGSVLQLFTGVQGGGVPVDPGYTTGSPYPGFDRPGEGMATGTNLVPRDMVVKVHRGEAIVPAKYNPAAGGAGRPQMVVNHQPNYQIDGTADQARAVQMMSEVAARSNQDLIELLKAEGKL